MKMNPKCKTCGKFEALNGADECYRCLRNRDSEHPVIKREDAEWDDSQVSDDDWDIGRERTQRAQDEIDFYSDPDED